MSTPTPAVEYALSALERDGRMLAVMEKLHRAHTLEVEQLHRELAELRDGLVALSNRIESVTRTVGGGLHSVKS